MKLINSLSLIILLMLSSISPLAQVRIMSPITTRDAQSLKKREPGWHYTPGVCTCPRLFDSEVSHDVGTWERKVRGGKKEFVEVEVYRVKAPNEVVAYMDSMGKGSFGARCQLEKYQLGEAAYKFTCPSRFKSIIYSKKGNFMVQVSGDAENIVGRFASYAVSWLPAS